VGTRRMSGSSFIPDMGSGFKATLPPSSYSSGLRDFLQMLRKGIKRTTPEQLARIEDKLESA
jgi:hypothetical protein